MRTATMNSFLWPFVLVVGCLPLLGGACNGVPPTDADLGGAGGRSGGESGVGGEANGGLGGAETSGGRGGGGAGGGSTGGSGTGGSGNNGGGGAPDTCGNGEPDEGEECDDGEETADCNANCTLADCGDGIINPAAGEQCDDEGESDTCNEDCTEAACGDGVVNATAGEECDGELASYQMDQWWDLTQNYCPECKLNVCGDGIHLMLGASCTVGGVDCSSVSGMSEKLCKLTEVGDRKEVAHGNT